MWQVTPYWPSKWRWLMRSITTFLWLVRHMRGNHSTSNFSINPTQISNQNTSMMDLLICILWQLLGVSHTEKVALLGGGRFWDTILVAHMPTMDSNHRHVIGKMAQKRQLPSAVGILIEDPLFLFVFSREHFRSLKV